MINHDSRIHNFCRNYCRNHCDVSVLIMGQPSQGEVNQIGDNLRVIRGRLGEVHQKGKSTGVVRVYYRDKLYANNKFD